MPEAKEIGCHLKITPVGETGGEEGGVELHVNQALYKFSRCRLEELNRLAPPTRAHGEEEEEEGGEQEEC